MSVDLYSLPGLLLLQLFFNNKVILYTLYSNEKFSIHSLYSVMRKRILMD